MSHEPYIVKRASGWIVLGKTTSRTLPRNRNHTKRLKSLRKLVLTTGQGLLFKVEKMGLPIQFRLAMAERIHKIGSVHA